MRARLKIFKYAFFVISALSLQFVWAITDLQTDSVTIDSSYIEVRQIDQSTLSQFYTEDAFNYVNGEEAETGIWNQIKFWIWYNILRFIFSDTAYPVFRILFYIIITGIFIYFILRILKIDITGMFYKNRQTKSTIDEKIIKESDAIDLEKLIQENMKKGAYREVIRLLFLRLLQILNKRGLISWSRDKTNADYIQEIGDRNLKEQFGYLSFLFEYIWYGDFRVTENRFKKIQQTFDDFHKNYNLPV